MKKIIGIIFAVVAILAVAWILSFTNYTCPATVTLELADGSSLRRISRALEKEKVIGNAFLFEWLARYQGAEKSLKSGEYEFSAGLKPKAVLSKLVSGLVKYYPITIPEGQNLKEIGKLLAARGLTTQDHWLTVTADPHWRGLAKTPGKNLEGYLFPDTYLIEKRTKVSDLLATMIGLLRKKVAEDKIKEAESKGLNLHSWLTLASLVEKETGIASERPLIAAVFLNRLKKNMLLQTDPSVIYGIENFNGNLTRADLERDTPYNTYTRGGLPPGPICSPGLDSMMAVLNPAETSYLYFVSKGDGSHHFSKTLEEHNHAVNYYQLHQGGPP